MNLEKFLTYVTHHSESIIQWLFFGILLLAGTLIARSLFGKKSDEAPGGADLHSALEKILAQTNKLENVPVDKIAAAAAPGAAAPVSDEQVQALKAEVAAREAELTQLKASGGKTSEETAGLSARIKELEAKLSEYEILEDDIADLSLYKDENARLKAEIDRLKGGGAAAPAPAEAVAAPAADDIVAEFAQAVGQEPAADPGAPAANIEIPDTGNPMADFESTVQLEKQLAGDAEPAPVPEAAAPEAPAAPEPPVAPAPPPPAPAEAVAAPGAPAAPVHPAFAAVTDPAAQAPVSSQAEADDLFAEFSTAAPEEGGATLDTDKMMAEMAALVSMEPASGSSLEESIDTEKMAAEASTLPKS